MLRMILGLGLIFGGLIWLAMMFPFLWVVYAILFGIEILSAVMD